MLKGLAKAIAARLSGDAFLQQLGAKTFHVHCPAGTPRPYILFSGQTTDREETNQQQVIETIQVMVTVIDNDLSANVEPATIRVKELLEDYDPEIEDGTIIRAAVANDPIYGDDDDGAGEVYAGEITFEYSIQKGKG